MKVALVAEWIDSWRGGAERSTMQFIHQLMQRGVDLHLFTRSRPSPAPGMQVHTIPTAAMSRTRRTLSFIRRVDALLASAARDREQFDVIHAITPCRLAHVYQPRGGTIAESIERNIAMWSNGAARTWKRHVNRFNVKQQAMLALERRILSADGVPVVVAISDYVIDQLRRHYDVPNHRIRKVLNGVDVEEVSHQRAAEERSALRRDFAITDEEFVILAVAHNFHLKGVQYLMQALALLLQRGLHNVRVLVVGKGDSNAWHTRAARMNIDRHLTFAGPTDRVSSFRYATDVFVHPTFYDPCSRVVLEAMCSGLPCVTTKWDGAAEMIVDGVSGYVLDDPKDADAIADRIMRLSEYEVRRRFAAEACKIADRVSMKRHAELMSALYDEIAERIPVTCP